MATAGQTCRVRFGPFEFDLSSGELWKYGTRLRLQEQPTRVLRILVSRPGELVTHEELRHELWPSDVFTDFEHGIHRAVNRIRITLGDTAAAPRFIETEARKGYRFLLKVDVVEPSNGRSDSATAEVVPPMRAGAQIGPQHIRSLRLKWVIPAGIGVVLIGFISSLIFPPRPRHTPSQIKSIAVLPLQNLSADAGQEYFADGITEELITSLAQSLPLRVISRTSVMRYRKTSEPVTQIARELRVEAIVEGAVARSGNRVTVTVQLIDASEDRHLWARKYDRDLKDILDIENEVSREIAAQVEATLTAQHVLDAAQRRPVNPEEYELCLLGRYHWNKRTAAGLLKSIDYFQQAIQLDPNYAPAYAGLASAYVILPSYDNVGWEDFLAKGEAAAHRALELDDRLAEAHATLGLIAVNHWSSQAKQSEYEFRQAIELNPNDATAHHWFSFYLFGANQRDRAVAEMEISRQLDPLSAIINADEGQFLYAVGKDEEARTRLLQAIELGPELGQPHETLALIDLEQGQKDESLREARLGLTLDQKNPRTLAEAGYVLAATGHTEEARRLLAMVTDQIHQGSACPICVAIIHIGLGQQSEALDILEQNSKVGIANHGLEYWRTIFDRLASEPRYQKLMAEAR